MKTFTRHRWLPWIGFPGTLLLALPGLAAETNAVTALPVASPLPDVGLSFLRVIGALIFVIAIFLGGVWLFRNWQRLAIRRGQSPKLNVLEVRSLGGRQALYVVGYERERFLLSSSPSGVALVTHLPAADESTEARQSPAPAQAFGAVLTQMLRGK